MALTERWMAAIRHRAYLASVDLAREKGPFPLFDRDAYLTGKLSRIWMTMCSRRSGHGIRNAGHLHRADGHDLLFADNVSSGAGTGLQLFLQPFRADARRVAPERGSLRLRLPALASATAEAAARLFRRRTVPFTRRPCADAGGGAEVHRCLDLQDHQLPGRNQLRGLSDIYMLAFETGCKGARPTDRTR